MTAADQWCPSTSQSEVNLKSYINISAEW